MTLDRDTLSAIEEILAIKTNAGGQRIVSNHQPSAEVQAQTSLPVPPAPDAAPQAHSMSEYRRVTAQGGNVLPPAPKLEGETPRTPYSAIITALKDIVMLHDDEWGRILRDPVMAEVQHIRAAADQLERDVQCWRRRRRFAITTPRGGVNRIAILGQTLLLL